MMLLRRSALRLASAPSVSLLPKTRTITSIASSPFRIQTKPVSVQFQKRWATGEAEAKKEDDLPISQLQPTPQEEVQNAISSDNAAAEASAGKPQTSYSATVPKRTSQYRAPAFAESANATEATEETIPAAETGETVTSRRVSPAFDDPMSARTIPKPTIYIGNLFFDVTENDLVKEMSRFGTIRQCRLMRDARGLSKGFGYIDFETTESATQAIQTLNQTVFEGRRLNVQYAAYESKDVQSRRGGDKPQKQLNPPSKTLFVGNMSFEMTDRDLNNLFRGIRNVIDVRVAIDRRTGQPRGFAHADFIDVKSAMEAIKVLEGKEIYGRKLRLDYSYGPSNSPKNEPRE